MPLTVECLEKFPFNPLDDLVEEFGMFKCRWCTCYFVSCLDYLEHLKAVGLNQYDHKSTWSKILRERSVFHESPRSWIYRKKPQVHLRENLDIGVRYVKISVDRFEQITHVFVVIPDATFNKVKCEWDMKTQHGFVFIPEGLFEGFKEELKKWLPQIEEAVKCF